MSDIILRPDSKGRISLGAIANNVTAGSGGSGIVILRYLFK